LAADNEGQMTHKKHTKGQKKKPAPTGAKCPVDAIVDKTIARRAEEARDKKERDVTVTLAPRRRVGKRILAIIKGEVKKRACNGMPIDDERLGDIAEDAAKLIVRALGLEPVQERKEKE